MPQKIKKGKKSNSSDAKESINVKDQFVSKLKFKQYWKVKSTSNISYAALVSVAIFILVIYGPFIFMHNVSHGEFIPFFFGYFYLSPFQFLILSTFLLALLTVFFVGGFFYYNAYLSKDDVFIKKVKCSNYSYVKLLYILNSNKVIKLFKFMYNTFSSKIKNLIKLILSFINKLFNIIKFYLESFLLIHFNPKKSLKKTKHIDIKYQIYFW